MKSPRQNKTGQLRIQTGGHTTRKKGEVSKFAKRLLSDFLPLSPKEKELMASCAGAHFDWSGKSKPLHASEHNIVRADFIRFLLLGGDNAAPLHEPGLELVNAWISGALNLWSIKIVANFRFRNCVFENDIILNDAHIIGGIWFYKCDIPSIKGDRLQTSRSLTLFGCNLSDAISLVGAKIEGDLHLGGSKVNSIVGTDGYVSGKLRLSNGFTSNGLIDFSRAHILGVIDCADAQFDGVGPMSFVAIRATIGSDVLFGSKFQSKGTIVLIESTVGGSIRGASATFDGNGAQSINLTGINVAGSLFLSRAVMKGEFNLLTARIGRDLSLSGANLHSLEGKALSGDRAQIGGGVFLDKGFSANGVRFLGAKIGANLYLDKATLTSEKDQSALNADRIVVAGNVSFCEGAQAKGEVRFAGARIGGSLTFRKSKLDADRGDALFCQGARIEGAFHLINMLEPVNQIDLSSAKVGRLVDDENSWGSKLTLNGFTYGTFAGMASIDASTRIRWLEKQNTNDFGEGSRGKKFKPQPWRQLRRVLLELGHTEDAREIAIRYEQHLRKIDHIGRTPTGTNRATAFFVRSVSRLAHYWFGVLIGYGYKPIRLVVWMFSIWLACGLFYWYAALEKVMAPSNPLVFQNDKYVSCKSKPSENNTVATGGKWSAQRVNENWYLCEDLPEEYTGFSPLSYSLDVLLPLVDLQQQNDWAPKVPTPKEAVFEELSAMSLKHVVRLVLWSEIIFGWVASLLLAAVLSGLTKRADE